jgi:hypothetical protein
VHDQITKVVTIMKVCDDMDDFRQKFARLFNNLHKWFLTLFCSFSHDPGSVLALVKVGES